MYLDFLDFFLSPVHEAAVLEVITVTSDLQLPAGEAFPFVEGDLEKRLTCLLRELLI